MSRTISTTMSSRTATQEGYRARPRPRLGLDVADLARGICARIDVRDVDSSVCLAVGILALHREPGLAVGQRVRTRSAKLLDVRSSWPLTARSAQLDRIARWYGDQQIGGVVLTGPAGVGKTRLGEEVLARFTDAPTSRAVGHPATKPIPFGALAHLLPIDLARDLGTGEEDRAALFHRARASLAEQARYQDDWCCSSTTSTSSTPPRWRCSLPLTVDRTVFVVATLRDGRPTPDVIATL